MRNYQSISFFKGLNALRFFAALLVLIHHAESLRKDRGLDHFSDFSFSQNGQHAVSFFFVLSGFLITYLLLKELKQTQQVSIKAFYLKRIFRIWPLYFLMIFIGVIIQPILIDWFHIPYTMPYDLSNSWYYFVFFVPGLVNFYFGNNLLEPLWSIGVEEVFYLFWAPLVKWFKKWILPLLIGVFVMKIGLLWWSTTADIPEFLRFLIRIHQFEAMAIGGMGAYFLFYYGDRIVAGFLFSKGMQVVLLSLIIAHLFFNVTLNYSWWNWCFKNTFSGAFCIYPLYLYLILNCAVNPRSIFTLQQPILNYLGQISYGIYMFHLLIITQIVALLQGPFSSLSFGAQTGLFYMLSIGLTIGVSSLSYHTFERFFERKKQRVLKKLNI